MLAEAVGEAASAALQKTNQPSHASGTHVARKRGNQS
jgi:hypothetical protein